MSCFSKQQNPPPDEAYKLRPRVLLSYFNFNQFKSWWEMKNKIEAIIFDLGGVYLEGSFDDFVDKACEVLGVRNVFNTNNKTNKIVFNPDFNKGRITIEKFFKGLFKIPISEKQMKKIKNIWTANWQATDEIIKLVENLKSNYKLAVLSNSDALGVKNCFKNGWFSHFDYLILSHEVGIIKPDKRIYKIALDKLNLKAQDCLFIDDVEDILKPARKMGMETILFKSIEQLKKEFDKLNIKY